MALVYHGETLVLLYRRLPYDQINLFPPREWCVEVKLSKGPHQGLAYCFCDSLYKQPTPPPSLLPLSFHNIHQKYQQPPCPLLTSSFIIDLPSSSSIGHHYHHHQQLPAIMHTSALQRARQLSITRTTTASQHAHLNSSPHTTTCHLAHFGSSLTKQHFTARKITTTTQRVFCF